MPEPDLSECDREPIHIPGAVQPHGLLLAIEPGSRTVVRAAGDASRLLGQEEPVLGRTAQSVLAGGASLLGRVPEALSAPLFLGSFDAAGGELDATAHRSGGLLILELEPAAGPRMSASDALSQVQAVSSAIERSHDVVRASQATAAAVRRFTGYDRIMVYRFLADGAGRVIAEDLAEGMEPLLNHHYPASDIPQQARALYLRNPIRVIPDVDYAPAPVTGGESEPPLDMSDCGLRSVSPIHIQYLKNMGVAASASISLVVDGALWGLIACHHREPKPIPYEVREMCKHVAHILAQELKAREDEAAHSEVLTLARRREEAVAAVAAGPSIEAALGADEARAVIPSDGAAVFTGAEVSLAGVTPPEEAVRALGEWLLRPGEPSTFASSALARHRPEADAYAAQASGLLAATVSREPPFALLWFRAEQIETVNWAGNPHKAAEPGDASGMLSPRKSFELWQETVRGSAKAWTPAETEAAARFADSIADLDRRNKLMVLNRQLRDALVEKDNLIAQKDLMMREAHHRVQNSLQLVTSILQLQEREVDEGVKMQFELARQRVMAVAMVHRRLWRADRIDTINLETFLAELAEGLARSWGHEWADQLKLRVAAVHLPTSQAVILALVVTELVTNAVKHAYGGAAGPIEVAVRRSGNQALAVTVCDHGVGTAGYSRAGSFGSRLTQALVGQLKGEIAIEDNAPGTRVTLTVPYLPAPESTRSG